MLKIECGVLLAMTKMPDRTTLVDRFMGKVDETRSAQPALRVLVASSRVGQDDFRLSLHTVGAGLAATYRGAVCWQSSPHQGYAASGQNVHMSYDISQQRSGNQDPCHLKPQIEDAGADVQQHKAAEMASLA